MGPDAAFCYERGRGRKRCCLLYDKSWSQEKISLWPPPPPPPPYVGKRIFLAPPLFLYLTENHQEWAFFVKYPPRFDIFGPFWSLFCFCPHLLSSKAENYPTTMQNIYRYSPLGPVFPLYPFPQSPRPRMLPSSLQSYVQTPSCSPLLASRTFLTTKESDILYGRSKTIPKWKSFSRDFSFLVGEVECVQVTFD